MANLTDLTIAQLVAAMGRKEASAVEVADAHLKKLDEHRALNAFITETPDKARAMANEFKRSFDEMARQSELDELRKEVEALIKKESGGTRVHIFDHTLRSGNHGERQEKLIREPVISAHNDYTEWSGPQRVRDLLPDEAETLLKKRFAIIQVWRAINKPIESDPLAMVDARTIEPQDLLVAERRYPNRVGQTYRLAYNPKHRWIYFPKMARDEAFVFKVYDSAKDGRARFTAHTAFVDPTTPPNAEPRQSIEMRALVFF